MYDESLDNTVTTLPYEMPSTRGKIRYRFHSQEFMNIFKYGLYLSETKLNKISKQN